MRYRAQTPSGDFTFGSSQKNFLIDSPSAVAQAVLTTLLLIYGEWYLDTTAGTPYLQGVMGYESRDTADATIQTQILGVTAIVSPSSVPAGAVPGQSVQAVTSITDYVSAIDPETRQYSASCVLNTIYGSTPFNLPNL